MDFRENGWGGLRPISPLLLLHCWLMAMLHLFLMPSDDLGNPLFPLLFIIVMEGFNRMLIIVREHHLFNGLKVAKAREEVDMRKTHLFFADDTLLLCKPSP